MLFTKQFTLSIDPEEARKLVLAYVRKLMPDIPRSASINISNPVNITWRVDAEIKEEDNKETT